ncbi:MAG: DUF4345 family protein [Pseudomonadales bacterium]
MKYIKPYLIFNLMVWLPWGLMCIFDLSAIEEIIGVTSINASGSTDLRVMYGGFQTAVGLMAALALYNRRFFPSLVFSLAFLGSCMALSRSYGVIVDDSATVYTLGVLAFEAFAGISGILWLKFLAREKLAL